MTDHDVWRSQHASRFCNDAATQLCENNALGTREALAARNMHAHTHLLLADAKGLSAEEILLLTAQLIPPTLRHPSAPTTLIVQGSSRADLLFGREGRNADFGYRKSRAESHGGSSRGSVAMVIRVSLSALRENLPGSSAGVRVDYSTHLLSNGSPYPRRSWKMLISI